MLEVWQPHQTTDGGVHSDDGPMAFRLMGVRYHRPISNSNQIVEVSSSQHRLRHQLGGSRNLGHHHGKERTKFRMEEHYLSVRYTESDDLKQGEAI